MADNKQSRMTKTQASLPWYATIDEWRFRVAIFAMPVLFLLASIFFAAESGWFLLNAETTEGEVVRVYEWDSGNPFDGDKVYGPVIRYTWTDGKPTEASLGVSHSDWNFPLESKRIIHFNPRQKDNVRLPGFFFNWALPSILLGLAVLSLFPMWLLWSWVSRKRREALS